MMKILSDQEQDIEIAASALRKGKLVAIPTETVYGLGADAFNEDALAAVFAAKRRPSFDPLIVHIAELAALDRLVDYDALSPQDAELLRRASEAFWPGPLTMILPKLPSVPDLATSGLPSVAVRFPAHPVARRIIALSTGAIAAPSANPFGYLSPTSAQHVAAQLGDRIDYIVDGGPCPVGVESTVLDLASDHPRILRPGGLDRAALEAVLGPLEVLDRSSERPNAPGQMKSHYAPRAPLYLYEHGALDPAALQPGQALLFWSREDEQEFWQRASSLNPADWLTRVLTQTDSQIEAAAALFAVLHELDLLAPAGIHAEKAPSTGLGEAINDRLYKARAAARVLAEDSAKKLI
jgi:L-threonylcarbamoyladenylate synthase